MSLADKTQPGQTDTITFDFDLPHAPAKVWRALTTPELLSQWLLPAVGFAPEYGTAFTLHTQPFPGWDGTVHCKVLEVEPGRLISYAWQVGDMELDTVVTFTLVATEAGTKLTLVQSGFKPAQKQNFGGARYGWNLMGGRLVELLAGLE